MQLVINLSGFYFALPVNVVDKVFDVEKISRTEDGEFLEGKKITLFDGEKFFNMRIKKSFAKKRAILFTFPDTVPLVVTVDATAGFVDDKKLLCIKRSELLKIYGFQLVSKFCICDDRGLIFFVDEEALDRRLTELMWS